MNSYSQNKYPLDISNKCTKRKISPKNDKLTKPEILKKINTDGQYKDTLIEDLDVNPDTNFSIETIANIDFSIGIYTDTDINIKTYLDTNIDSDTYEIIKKYIKIFDPNKISIGIEDSKTSSLIKYYHDYPCDYNNLYQINISKHIFTLINLITWFEKTNCTINKNGDLVTRMYLKVTLPEVNKITETIPKITYKIPNHITKITIVSETVDLKYILPDGLEELYIAYRNYNDSIGNFDLQKDLKLISICSKEFNQPLTNLPDNLEYLYINSNHFNKPLDNLPSKLKVLSICTSDFTHKLDNLPQGLKVLNINVSFNLNYSLFDYLPETLEYLYIKCTNIVSISELKNLPVGLKVKIIKNDFDFSNTKGWI